MSIPIFRVSAYEVDDGYGIHVDVEPDIPQDVVRKIAQDVAEQLNANDLPQEGETITRDLA